MTEKELKDLIYKGEKIDVEFKKSENELSKNVYESVCSFNKSSLGNSIANRQERVDFQK